MIQTKEATTFEKYPEYKDSGSYWSGQIPEEWNALPIRAIFEERNEKNDGPKTDFILSVTKDRGVIPYDEKGAVGNNKSEEIERYKLVYPNDFVINKMNVVIGSLGMSKYFGAFSQVYLVYKPKTSQINIEYYSYIFSNPTFYKSLIKFCTGIMELRESLNKSDFKKIILPFPSFETQTSIVNFLDNKTSKIDTTIAQKEQMIALLKERKQIIIQNAVTGKWSMVNGQWSMTPKEKMKDSGVEWIGEIPEGWEVMNLRYAFEFLNYKRIPLSAIERETMQGKYPYYGASGIIDYVNDYIFDEETILIAEDGANLLSKSTPLAFVATGQYWVNNHAHILKPKFDGFLYWAELLSLVDYTVYITGAAQPKLSRENLGSVKVVVPSETDLLKISEYIKTVNVRFEEPITLQQSQIEKLKEYKATLIDGAVTGKIMVNG